VQNGRSALVVYPDLPERFVVGSAVSMCCDTRDLPAAQPSPIRLGSVESHRFFSSFN